MMEVQGDILTIRHAPLIVNENKRLRGQISQLEAVVKMLMEEIELLKSLKGSEEKRYIRGKLKTRKNWKPS